MAFEDYDILSVVEDSVSAASYRVKNKKSDEIFVWRTVDYNSLCISEKNHLINKITARKSVQHPNVLRFYDFIDQEESKIVYITTEYCPNGSLKNLIDSCISNKKRFSEDLLCKILYQTVCALKTLGQFIGIISTEEIFLDENFNVKLYNFNTHGKHSKCKVPKMSALGIVMFELFTLKAFEKNTYEKEFKLLTHSHYSSDVLSLIMQIIKDNNDMKKHIDKILCHPTLLLKLSLWNNNRLIKACPEVATKNHNNVNELSLDKLRKYQSSLKVREQKLLEREQKLWNKEKRIVLLEKQAHEKIAQLEMYMKHSKHSSSTDSICLQITRKSCENLNISCSAECGDSVIMPSTSTRLNPKNIAKPATFTRTMSEKKIRFKGHSPLKEINFNRRKSFHRQPKSKQQPGISQSTSENDSEQSGSRKTIPKKSKLSQNIYENDLQVVTKDSMSTAWTEENKRHAFEMLRIMNETMDKENCLLRTRHTQL